MNAAGFKTFPRPVLGCIDADVCNLLQLEAHFAGFVKPCKIISTILKIVFELSYLYTVFLQRKFVKFHERTQTFYIFFKLSFSDLAQITCPELTLTKWCGDGRGVICDELI